MWNHRVVKKSENGEVYYQIHEAYYNDKNELCGLTENPVTPLGESVEDLKVGLKLMLTAFKEPVLIEGEISYGDWNDN